MIFHPGQLIFLSLARMDQWPQILNRQTALFDVGGVEIHAYKRSKQCRRCRTYTTLLKDFGAFSAMYVKDIEDGVCGFYATLHRVMLLILLISKVSKVSNTMYCIQWPLTPLGGKAIWKAFHLVDLAVHHQSVQGGSFVNFLGLVKLQRWLQARHTANPQFFKLRGNSKTR